MKRKKDNVIIWWWNHTQQIVSRNTARYNNLDVPEEGKVTKKLMKEHRAISVNIFCMRHLFNKSHLIAFHLHTALQQICLRCRILNESRKFTGGNKSLLLPRNKFDERLIKLAIGINLPIYPARKTRLYLFRIAVGRGRFDRCRQTDAEFPLICFELASVSAAVSSMA